MKILFVWTGVTSYMADCWRRLQQEPDVELKILVEQVTSGRDFDAAAVLNGLDATLVDAQTSEIPQHYSPDVIFAVGWHSKIVRAVVTHKAWRGVPKVCCFDLPWRWQLRCLAARFVLGPFLRNYAAAYVPGRACERYAKWLGFKRIQKGLFSIDEERFEERDEGDKSVTRRGFLYVGRFSTEKRIDLIVRAFDRYRELGGTWSLDLYGAGPLAEELASLIASGSHPHLSLASITIHPFVQTDAIPGLYRSHACLVLASAFDPWPLVALEAKASGCEVIQSDRCGNRLELDTRVVKFGDVEAMAREMLKVEQGGVQRREDAQVLKMWDCKTWAKRTLKGAQELRGVMG